MTADFNCGCEVELGITESALPEGRSLTDAEAALTGLVELLESQASQESPATAEVRLNQRRRAPPYGGARRRWLS